MSVLVNQSQAIQSNANEFRLCAFLDLVSKSKLEGYIVMEGTFRLCAFLFCVSKSKPQGHIVMQGTLRLCAFLWNAQGRNITVLHFYYLLRRRS